MSDIVTFKTGMYLDDVWLAGLEDFLAWLGAEQKRSRPTGPCGQDVLTTSGARGLLGRYPAFADAYSAWAGEKRKEAGAIGRK